MRQDLKVDTCVLCEEAQATRKTLAADGYLYDCPACGGRYAANAMAVAAAQGGLATEDVRQKVRATIARGDLPKVGFVDSEWFCKPVDRQT